ncbi:MAG: arginase [Bacteroidota bacterium]|nr:arginase [Bacteroidota bacterium]MDP4233828.1 arginase [Bacteroidota bacterium]MDP4242473.1 arginase [Bacteroidota bacterium]MDP4289061.1 arginase [Bacteroidota bacterium]
MSSTHNVRIIGFPMDLGAGRRGVDMGPSALRIAGVSERLRELGYQVHDAGDIEVQTAEVQAIEDVKLPYLPEIARACTVLAKEIERALDEGEFPLVLGGDHSMAIGSIAGLAAHCRRNGKRLGVIWIDAHSDINVPESSPSGNIHGMPVAVSLGLGAPELTGISGNYPKLDAKELVYIGLRSIDPGERDLIHRLGIEAHTMADLDKDGVFPRVSKAIAMLRDRADHIHVSFDLDSVDPTVASGVGTPVAGGLTYREAHLIMEAIADTGVMASMEVAEVNPILDVRNASAEFAVGLIASSMGKRIL